MRRLTCAIVLAAFVFSCGGNWAVLQGVAWASMIREYAQVVPLTQAVQMTLSGEYPCEICKALADKKAAEQQKAFTFDKYDKGCPLPVTVGLIAPKIDETDHPDRLVACPVRSEIPPTPPPRSRVG